MTNVTMKKKALCESAEKKRSLYGQRVSTVTKFLRPAKPRLTKPSHSNMLYVSDERSG